MLLWEFELYHYHCNSLKWLQKLLKVYKNYTVCQTTLSCLDVNHSHMCQKTYYFLSTNYKSISNTLHAYYHDNSVHQSSLWLSYSRNEHWGKYTKYYQKRISINTESVGYTWISLLGKVSGVKLCFPNGSPIEHKKLFIHSLISSIIYWVETYSPLMDWIIGVF